MDEGPVEIGPVVLQVLDELCPNRKLKDEMIAETRQQMEEIVSEFEWNVGLVDNPHALGVQLARDILREQELLHEQLATLMQWDRERGSRAGRS